jgi:Tfp pilus assembly protein PilF
MPPAAPNEAEARRTYNKALALYRANNAAGAIAPAEAATLAGRGSYLEDDALLLRAQAAEKAGNANAALFYAEVAQKQPQSDFAAISLYKAMEVAAANGDTAAALRYKGRLLAEYPNRREAKRARWKSLPGEGEEKR